MADNHSPQRHCQPGFHQGGESPISGQDVTPGLMDCWRGSGIVSSKFKPPGSGCYVVHPHGEDGTGPIPPPQAPTPQDMADMYLDCLNRKGNKRLASLMSPLTRRLCQLPQPRPLSIKSNEKNKASLRCETTITVKPGACRPFCPGDNVQRESLRAFHVGNPCGKSANPNKPPDAIVYKLINCPTVCPYAPYMGSCKQYTKYQTLFNVVRDTDGAKQRQEIIMLSPDAQGWTPDAGMQAFFDGLQRKPKVEAYPVRPTSLLGAELQPTTPSMYLTNKTGGCYGADFFPRENPKVPYSAFIDNRHERHVRYIQEAWGDNSEPPSQPKASTEPGVPRVSAAQLACVLRMLKTKPTGEKKEEPKTCECPSGTYPYRQYLHPITGHVIYEEAVADSPCPKDPRATVVRKTMGYPGAAANKCGSRPHLSSSSPGAVESLPRVFAPRSLQGNTNGTFPFPSSGS